MRAGSGVPSGARRFARDSAQVWATLVLAGVVVAAPMLQTIVRESSTAAIAQSWRGAYDLLVLAPDDGMTPALLDSTGAELVDPNFGNVSGAVIAQALVEEVAGLPDVEVAAPVGLVGRWGNTMDWAFISIPTAVFTEMPAQTFRIEWSTSSDDGLGPRLVQHEVGYIAVDTSDWDGSDGRFTERGVRVDASIGVDGGVVDGALTFSWWPLPVLASTVFAIDPVAEKQLLGPAAGAFLDPLIEYDRLVATSAQPVTAARVADMDASDPVRHALERLPSATGALHGMYGPDNPLTPYLRNADAYVPLELTATVAWVEGFRSGLAVAAPSDDDAQADNWSDAGQTRVDLSQERRPFAGASVFVPWPGTTAGGANYFIADDRSTGLSRLSTTTHLPQDAAEAEDGIQTRLAVNAEGFVRPVPNAAADPLDGRGLGQEQTYRRATSGTGAAVGTRTLAGAAPIEVGTYEPSAIAVDREAAAYVPLGAYDPAQVTVGDAHLEPTVQWSATWGR